MPRVIGDTTFQADDGRDPTTGPQLSAKAVGGGTLMPQGGQAGQVLGRQPPWGPGGRAAPSGSPGTGHAAGGLARYERCLLGADLCLGSS